MKSFLNYLFGKEDSNRTRSQNSWNEKLKEFTKLLKHLPKIAKIIFPKCLSVSVLLLLLLIVNVVALEFLIYQVGLITGSFTKSLTSRDSTLFTTLAWKALLLIIVNALMVSTKDYIAQLLGIVGRKCLTLKIHDMYFKNKNFYYLQHSKLSKSVKLNSNKSTNKVGNFSEFDLNSSLQSTSILINQDQNEPNTTTPTNLKEAKEKYLDNPDQRITQDANSLCTSFSVILPTVLVSPFLIAWYTYQVLFIKKYDSRYLL